MTWKGPMHQAERHAKRARKWERHGSESCASSEWCLCVVWLLSALFEGEIPERQVFPPDSAYGPIYGGPPHE